MPLIQDDRLFGDISREFVVRHVDLLARILHSDPSVPFDVFAMTAEADRLLFDLCFFSLASVEEQSGFDRNGNVYTPLLAFQTRRVGDSDVLVGDTVVHGLVEDDTIKEGLALARSKLN